MKKGVLGTNCANHTNYGVPIKAPMKTKDDQKGEGKEDLLCIDILLVNALSLSMLSTTKKYIYRERDSDRQNLGPKECLDGEILYLQLSEGGGVRGPTATFGQKSTTFHLMQKPSNRVKIQ